MAPTYDREQIRAALLAVDANPELKLALETKRGFVDESPLAGGTATEAGAAKKK